MSQKKKVLITFLGNLNYDTRCKNLFDTLSANGFEVEFIGFDWLTSDFIESHGRISIYKIKKSFLSISFYLKFIWHLKIKLVTCRASIIFAEDIYTLPFVVIFGKLKRAEIFYDSRELFGFLAGLKHKKLKQFFWKWVEKLFIKKANYVIATGQMDVEFLKNEFKLNNTLLLRNLPRYYKSSEIINLHSQLGIEKNIKLLLYQGMLLKGRGIEKIFAILKEIPECRFLIAGGGDFEEYYKNLAVDMNIKDQVFFLGKFTQGDLPKLTASADVGISIIENLSKSYYYALPNKLFEYIMAEIPVIVSDLPQMKETVEKYDVGFAVDYNDDNQIISAIKRLTEDKNLYESKMQNCHIASQELNWEKEVAVLLRALN